MSDLYQDRHYRLGWKLLIFQNLILFVFPLLASPILSTEVFQFLASLGIIRGMNVVFDYIFTFIMILDIFAILLISIGTLKYFLSLKEKHGDRNFRSRNFYIPLTGLLWVTCSFLWRLPYYIMGGFELGLAENSFVEIDLNPTLKMSLRSPLLYLFLILGSFCFFFFLYFQDKHFSETFETEELISDLGNLGFGRSTILGGLNIVGVFFMLFGSTLTPQSIRYMELYGSNPNGLFLIIGIMLKFLVIPPLAIWTSVWFLSSNKLKFKSENSEPSKFMKILS